MGLGHNLQGTLFYLPGFLVHISVALVRAIGYAAFLAFKRTLIVDYIFYEKVNNIAAFQLVHVSFIVTVKFPYAFHVEFVITQLGYEPCLRLKYLSKLFHIIMSLDCLYNSTPHLFGRIFKETVVDIFAHGAIAVVYPGLCLLHHKPPVVLFGTAEGLPYSAVFVFFRLAVLVKRRGYNQIHLVANAPRLHFAFPRLRKPSIVCYLVEVKAFLLAVFFQPFHIKNLGTAVFLLRI